MSRRPRAQRPRGQRTPAPVPSGGRPGPTRTCVGCRRADAATELVRIVLDGAGGVVFDLAGGAFGRGAWVHPNARCLELAPRGLAHGLRSPVSTTGSGLRERLVEAANRRVDGLLASAQRGRHLAVGADAVNESLAAGDAELVLVATDARAAASGPRVLDAIASGRARAWGTKARIGRAVGRGDTGVVAVSHRGLSRALEQSVFMSQVPDAQRSRAP